MVQMVVDDLQEFIRHCHVCDRYALHISLRPVLYLFLRAVVAAAIPELRVKF